MCMYLECMSSSLNISEYPVPLSLWWCCLSKNRRIQRNSVACRPVLSLSSSFQKANVQGLRRGLSNCRKTIAQELPQRQWPNAKWLSCWSSCRQWMSWCNLRLWGFFRDHFMLRNNSISKAFRLTSRHRMRPTKTAMELRSRVTSRLCFT